MTQPNYHLMKVKANIHSKYYSVPIVAVYRKTEDGGKEGKNKNKKYNRPRCAVCCHGLLGAEKVVEFSVGAGKAFRSEGSQPLDDNASFHGRRREGRKKQKQKNKQDKREQ